MVWPVSDTIAGIEATVTVHLGMLPHKAFVIILFDRDDEVSAKVFESMHRAGDDAKEMMQHHTMYVSIHRYLLEMMYREIMRTTAT